MRKLLLVVFVSIFTLVSLTAAGLPGNPQGEKKSVTNIDQLPRHTYKSTVTPMELITNENAFNEFAQRVRKNMEQDLATYDIKDSAALKQYYNIFISLDFLAGKYEAALNGIKTLAALETKEGARLLSGISLRMMIAAGQQTNTWKGNAFEKAFAANLENEIREMPWKPIQENIISSRNQMEMFTRKFLLGVVQSSLEPAFKKAGYISGDMAKKIVFGYMMVNKIIPLRTQLLTVYGKLIAANRVEKPDIWAERDVDLSGTEGLEPVVVAIWDTGVDTPVFPNHLWRNPKEKKDGKDTDGNGYVDDVHGIAYDMKARPVPNLLFNIEDGRKNLGNNLALIKGYNAMANSIDTPEAAKLKKRLAEIKPGEVGAFLDNLMEMVYYMHGTHVAGIAIKGNPYARILTARVTMDYRRMPDVPTKEVARQTAQMYKDVVTYFKAHGVRVVNMSWSVLLKEVETALAANGVGKTAGERGKLARELFDIMKAGFKEAIESAPGILFVAAAGNSDENPEFLVEIPTGLGLPNLMVAGAVDQAGDRTSFTCFGKIVDVYSNGFQVVGYLPGGDRMPASGTSMAAPNVVNLAAKLFALNPKLNAVQIKKLILESATKNQDFLLIHPKQSVELLNAQR